MIFETSEMSCWYFQSVGAVSLSPGASENLSFYVVWEIKNGSISFMQLGCHIQRFITSKSNGILWFSGFFFFLWFSGTFFHSCYYSQSILENGKNSRAGFLAELGNRSPWYLSAKCQSPLNPNLTHDGSPWVSDKASLAKWNFSVIHWQTQIHEHQIPPQSGFECINKSGSCIYFC